MSAVLEQSGVVQVNYAIFYVVEKWEQRNPASISRSLGMLSLSYTMFKAKINESHVSFVLYIYCRYYEYVNMYILCTCHNIYMLWLHNKNEDH